MKLKPTLALGAVGALAGIVISLATTPVPEERPAARTAIKAGPGDADDIHPKAALEVIAAHQLKAESAETVAATLAAIRDDKARDASAYRLTIEALRSVGQQSDTEKARKLAATIVDKGIKASAKAEIAATIGDLLDPAAPPNGPEHRRYAAAVADAKQAAADAQGAEPGAWSRFWTWAVKQRSLFLSAACFAFAVVAGPVLAGAGRLFGSAVAEKLGQKTLAEYIAEKKTPSTMSPPPGT